MDPSSCQLAGWDRRVGEVAEGRKLGVERGRLLQKVRYKRVAGGWWTRVETGRHFCNIMIYLVMETEKELKTAKEWVWTRSKRYGKCDFQTPPHPHLPFSYVLDRDRRFIYDRDRRFIYILGGDTKRVICLAQDNATTHTGLLRKSFMKYIYLICK